MRFLNHSCEPAAHFQEMTYGSTHRVVVVTRRAVARGEEVTVSYGEQLWFVCRRGSRSCQHRDLPDDKGP